MAQRETKPYLLVYGFIRLNEKKNKLSKIITNDIKHMIYAFYPKTHQIITNKYKKISLSENLSILRLAYDKTTKSIYLCGKKSSDQHNFYQICNEQCEWIDFKNNPPYFWQIQCLLNLEDDDHCIAIVKDAQSNFCYFLFNKHTLEWNKSINQILIACDENCIFIHIEQCIFIKENNVLLLCVSKEIACENWDSIEIFEVIVFEMHNIQKPKFLMKEEFKLDYRRYNVIKHPLFADKIILFGGISTKNEQTKSFLDTFMVIEIDKKTMTICEDIAWEFENEFGADSFNAVLKERFEAELWEREAEFCTVESAEYFGFNHCVIGHELFVFGGFCRRNWQSSLLVYNFLENKWSLSKATFPKEISRARAVWDTNQRKLHLFAMNARPRSLDKRDYKWHYAFDLTELC